MAITVTVAQLKRIASETGAPLAGQLVGPINRYADQFGITTQRRMSHFLAHMAHETGGFKSLSESLNYSVSGLLKTFSRARISAADAKRLGRPDNVKTPISVARQREIANLVYGGAWGKKNLGNLLPDDGWTFRGGGPYQLTGRYNYERFGKAAGVDLVANPELARDPDRGVEVAARYFMARMADAADRDDIAGTTEALNGGKIGLDDRKKYLARAKKEFGTAAAKPAPAPKPVPAPVIVPANPVASDIVLPVQLTNTKGDPNVYFVQQQLSTKGFPEVGLVDGKMGTRTQAAILSFRLAHNPQLEPFTATIDQPLVDALYAYSSRPVSAQRAATTTEELKKGGEPTVLTAENMKTAGYVVGGFAAVGGVDQQGKIDQAKSYFDQAGAVREMIETALDLIQWAAQKWWIFVVIAAVFFVIKAHRVARLKVAEVRTGVVLAPDLPNVASSAASSSAVDEPDA